MTEKPLGLMCSICGLQRASPVGTTKCEHCREASRLWLDGVSDFLLGRMPTPDR